MQRQMDFEVRATDQAGRYEGDEGDEEEEAGCGEPHYASHGA